MATMSMPSGWHNPDPYSYTDHIYKEEHGVLLSLRCWQTTKPSSNSGSPWLFWIHGGGFSAGYAERIAPWIHAVFLEQGYHIVSVNYRLCPQVSFDEQRCDLKDAWAWCQANLPTKIGFDSIDLSTSVIGGDSAGGCFASLSGLDFEPKPKVIVNLYGPVQLYHPHFHIPAANASEQLASVVYSRPRTTDELEAALVDNNPSRAKTRYVWWHDLETSLSRLQAYLGLPDYTVEEDEHLRMDLYKYMSIKRNRFSSVFRKHTCEDDVGFETRLRNNSCLDLIDGYQGSAYPPTFFLHGDADSAAPIGPSQEFYEKLKRLGVSVDARWPKGAEHSFDVFIAGPHETAWQDNLVPCFKFVDRHIRNA